MSQESDVCCTTSMYDIQNRCIPDEIDLFYFKTCIITHNNNVIEQNINVSMFDILSVKEPHSYSTLIADLRWTKSTMITNTALKFGIWIIRLSKYLT